MTPAARLHRCAQCGKLRDLRYRYMRRSYCDRRCAHDAGDRSLCWNWRDCGCTAYSKKRRLLREHREQLRVAEEVLEENDLDDEYAECAAEEIDGPYSLAHMDFMDEGSDAEDPEAALRTENRLLRAELDDRDCTQQVIELATASLDRGALVRDLERSRMFTEDLLSHALRNSSP